MVEQAHKRQDTEEREMPDPDSKSSNGSVSTDASSSAEPPALKDGGEEKKTLPTTPGRSGR